MVLVLPQLKCRQLFQILSLSDLIEEMGLGDEHPNYLLFELLLLKEVIEFGTSIQSLDVLVFINLFDPIPFVGVGIV
jgi:hypothetical protein